MKTGCFNLYFYYYAASFSSFGVTSNSTKQSFFNISFVFEMQR